VKSLTKSLLLANLVFASYLLTRHSGGEFLDEQGEVGGLKKTFSLKYGIL
jgi:hypothetical protein